VEKALVVTSTLPIQGATQLAQRPRGGLQPVRAVAAGSQVTATLDFFGKAGRPRSVRRWWTCAARSASAT